MSLVQTIAEDLQDSLLKKQSARTAVLRLLRNGLKNKAIEEKLSETDLSDEQVVAVLRQEAKKHKESIEAFRSGGRSELVDKEKAELNVIESYLPTSMSAEDIDKIIEVVITEEQLEEPYQFGRLMGLVVKKVAGRADGGFIKEQVEKFVSP